MILPRRVAQVLMVGYLGAVGYVVFRPTADVATESVGGVWAWLHEAGMPELVTPFVVEFAGNVVMFLPLSLIGHSLRPSWRAGHWLVAGLAGTLFIEAVQGLFLPGRSAAAEDVVANALGALLGYPLVRALRRR